MLADSEALGLWLAEMLAEIEAEIDADSEALGLCEADILLEIEADILALRLGSGYKPSPLYTHTTAGRSKIETPAVSP